MFLSIFSDELDGDLREALPLLQSWGFERCDLRGAIFGKKLHDLGADDLVEVKRLLRKHGMKLGALETSLAKVHLPDAERQGAERKKLEAIIRAADELDCRLVRAFNFWQPGQEGTLGTTPGALERVLEMFRPIADRAAQAGLVLAIENCGQTTEEALAVLDALGRPEWGLAWDAYNTWNSTERRADEAAYIVKNVRRSKMVHVKAESILPELTSDPVPWERVLAACQAAGLAGPVSIETHNPKGSGLSDTEASLRTTELVRRAWPKSEARNVYAAAAPRSQTVRSYEDKPVGFVVVGLGMGRVRARELLTTPGCELVGVCDRDEQLGAKAGTELGVPHTAELAPWLRNPRAEAVLVVTPTGLHGALAGQAFGAGRHVLTTKPMEASLPAADEMIAAAESADRFLAVDFGLRHEQRVLDLKMSVESGAFGRLLSATAALKVLRTPDYFRRKGGWRGTKKLDGGGILSNQAIHHIDEIIFTLGMPSEVRCDIWTQNHEIEAEDLGTATWRYCNGLVVTFFATTCFPEDTWYERLEVHGTEAACLSTRGGPEGDSVRWYRAGAWSDRPPVRAGRPWLNSMDNLAAAIRTGAPLVCSGRDGRRSQAVLDAMYRSAAAGGGWTGVDAGPQEKPLPKAELAAR
ncbi:MAG TPA: TIM barrel protein [Planctomycetota bacterium]|nr:TIM barrel protein [Planctomycetota bacterium]